MDNRYVLQLKKVVKRFPGVLALDHADLEVARGEVLAMIGENGAGKSTMVKIISGAYRLDSGEMLLDGEMVPPHSTPKERMDSGIAIIYQELTYLNEMSLAENLFMGSVPLKGAFKVVDYPRMRKEARELMTTFGLDYDPDTLVKDLSVAEKQIIEILRAVSKDVKVLIMDEPTSSLNEVETERLFDFIRDLKTKGVSIIYISHKLEEVYAVADRVQVMRDGKRVAVSEVKEISTTELVTQMVGRTITDMYPKELTEIGDEVLRVENLSCHRAKNASFNVRKGEILGLFGLVGSGRVEAIEGILGIKSIDSGKIFMDGNEVMIPNPIEAKKLGIGYIPSDRKQDGLVLINTVKNNLTITMVDELGRGVKMDSRREEAYCEKWIGKLGVRTPSNDAVMETLSGGNQQKVVIAKWLLTEPKVLIMNDPTRGVDVGAKVEIYKVMEELCREGVSIIMVSSELPETMGITDRMIIFADGGVVGEVQRKDYDQESILHMAVGGEEHGN
ncbi:MAG: sugar ABC transporter ATP-binding protein [Spirochaetaceae bacterium]|nr:sugar ABC transporter ATP-binding protein [Spirochaetaceae bacterium]